MEILKKILVALLSIILVNLIVLLIINCTIKKTIINDIVLETIKNNSTNILMTNPKDKDESVLSNNDIVQEVIQSQEINELLNEYLDEMLSTLSDEKDIEELDTQKIQEDIIDYIKNNKEQLSEKIGVEITDEMIENAKDYSTEQDTSSAIKQYINNQKNNMSDQEKNILKMYKVIASTKLRIVIIISIIITIILIALIQKSLTNWIKNTSIALVISGLSAIIMSLILKLLIEGIMKTAIRTSTMMTIGIIVLIFGIIMYILYKIFKIKPKKEITNEIS